MVCWNGFGVIFGSEKHANNCKCSFHLPKTEVYRPDIVCLHCQFGVFLGDESLTKAGDLSHVLLIARRFSRQRHMSHVPFLVKEVQDPKHPQTWLEVDIQRCQNGSLMSICSMGSCY